MKVKMVMKVEARRAAQADFLAVDLSSRRLGRVQQQERSTCIEPTLTNWSGHQNSDR
jgi:hypothetical protein